MDSQLKNFGIEEEYSSKKQYSNINVKRNIRVSFNNYNITTSEEELEKVAFRGN